MGPRGVTRPPFMCPGCGVNPPGRLTAREWDYCNDCSGANVKGRDDGDLLTRREQHLAKKLRRWIRG